LRASLARGPPRASGRSLTPNLWEQKNVQNNPFRYTDPSGFQAAEFCKGPDGECNTIYVLPMLGPRLIAHAIVHAWKWITSGGQEPPNKETETSEQTENADDAKGTDGAGTAPKASPQFEPPTNPAQPVPRTLPDGHSVRVMPPTPQYPSGYWVQTNANGQPVDPSTGKPPANVTRPQARARTHIPLPPAKAE
jgi:hypothetical protein